MVMMDGILQYFTAGFSSVLTVNMICVLLCVFEASAGRVESDNSMATSLSKMP
jgi:hypothetical protein